jgi:hypothetical protein
MKQGKLIERPDETSLLAVDEDREAVLGVLAAHASAGRLLHDEFDARLAAIEDALAESAARLRRLEDRLPRRNFRLPVAVDHDKGSE